MRYKTWFALLLSVLLLMSGVSGYAEMLDIPDEGENAGEAGQAEGEMIDHLTVANATQLYGSFFTGMWGNGTSDIDVRHLIHGYDLIEWNGAEAQFLPDPSVVSGVAVMDNGVGDRSYVFVLCSDLCYSDGSKITAWDYAFSLLMKISPEVSEIGGVPDHCDYLLGYDEYMEKIALPAEGETPEWHCEGGVRIFPDGSKPCLRGVRVLTDDTLMVTLDHEYLPFFFEVGLLSCTPYPISVIAPGVVVKDDGEGVYLANEDETVDEPVFTCELLEKTILDPETGYLYAPSVTSGPYVLKSFDGVTAEFDMNPYFKGNSDGEKPLINHLTYTLADNDTMVEKLASGEFDVINKVTKASTLMEAMMLMREGGFLMSNYPRTGYSHITFDCERPTVSSIPVRQAIAWCMDRDQITRDYTGGFGVRVDSYYGLGQWMVGLVQGTVPAPVTAPEDEDDEEALAAYEAELAVWDELSLDDLTVYTVDLDRARALLDGDGWKLNDDGLREKDGVVLDLKMIYPEGSMIYESFETNLVPNLEAVGIRLTMEPVPMTDLLRYYYKRTVDGFSVRDVDMIYLATNFDLLFDPSTHFAPSVGAETDLSYASNNDEKIFDLAMTMRRTEPGHLLEYVQRWLEFEKQVNETLPVIPIYSNVYFDFYNENLHNYDIDEHTSWGRAILGASYYAAPQTEDQEEPGEEFEETGDDFEIVEDDDELLEIID